jgi:hypothetical protein
VLNIKHVQLGQLIGVEVESLYCVFEFISGEHIYVDSEEHPGEAYDPPLPEITDWSLTVKMLPIT